MAKTFNGKYEYDPDGMNTIISEKGDTFLALREIRWSENKDFKPDLRHYRSTEEGDITLKGCSFTHEDADELVRVLIEAGYGDDKELGEVILGCRPNLAGVLCSPADITGDDARVRLFSKLGKNEIEMVENPDSPDTYYDPRYLIDEEM